MQGKFRNQSALLAVCFVITATVVAGREFQIYATGEANGRSPMNWGMGKLPEILYCFFGSYAGL